MARLGTRTPGGPTYDLHQGNLRVDERAIVDRCHGCSPAAALQSMVTDAITLAGIAGRTVGHLPARIW